MGKITNKLSKYLTEAEHEAADNERMKQCKERGREREIDMMATWRSMCMHLKLNFDEVINEAITLSNNPDFEVHRRALSDLDWPDLETDGRFRYPSCEYGSDSLRNHRFQYLFDLLVNSIWVAMKQAKFDDGDFQHYCDESLKRHLNKLN